jgi:hypothetical protein
VLASSHSQLQHTVNALQSECASLRHSLSSLQDQFDELDEDFEATEEELRAARGAIEGKLFLKDDTPSLRRRMKDGSLNARHHANFVTALRFERNAGSDANNASRLDAHLAAISRSGHLLSSLSADHASLTAHSIDQARTISSLEEQVASMRSKLRERERSWKAEYQRLFDRAEEQIKESQEQHDALVRQHADTVAGYESKLALLQSSHASLENQVASDALRYRSLERLLAATQLECDNTVAAMAALQLRMDRSAYSWRLQQEIHDYLRTKRNNVLQKQQQAQVDALQAEIARLQELARLAAEQAAQELAQAKLMLWHPVASSLRTYLDSFPLAVSEQLSSTTGGVLSLKVIDALREREITRIQQAAAQVRSVSATAFLPETVLAAAQETASSASASSSSSASMTAAADGGVEWSALEELLLRAFDSTLLSLGRSQFNQDKIFLFLYRECAKHIGRIMQGQQPHMQTESQQHGATTSLGRTSDTAASPVASGPKQPSAKFNPFARSSPPPAAVAPGSSPTAVASSSAHGPPAAAAGGLDVALLQELLELREVAKASKDAQAQVDALQAQCDTLQRQMAAVRAEAADAPAQTSPSPSDIPGASSALPPPRERIAALQPTQATSVGAHERMASAPVTIAPQPTEQAQAPPAEGSSLHLARFQTELNDKQAGIVRLQTRVRDLEPEANTLRHQLHSTQLLLEKERVQPLTPNGGPTVAARPSSSDRSKPSVRFSDESDRASERDTIVGQTPLEPNTRPLEAQEQSQPLRAALDRISALSSELSTLHESARLLRAELAACRCSRDQQQQKDWSDERAALVAQHQAQMEEMIRAMEQQRGRAQQLQQDSATRRADHSSTNTKKSICHTGTQTLALLDPPSSATLSSSPSAAALVDECHSLRLDLSRAEHRCTVLSAEVDAQARHIVQLEAELDAYRRQAATQQRDNRQREQSHEARTNHQRNDVVEQANDATAAGRMPLSGSMHPVSHIAMGGSFHWQSRPSLPGTAGSLAFQAQSRAHQLVAPHVLTNSSRAPTLPPQLSQHQQQQLCTTTTTTVTSGVGPSQTYAVPVGSTASSSARLPHPMSASPSVPSTGAAAVPVVASSSLSPVVPGGDKIRASFVALVSRIQGAAAGSSGTDSTRSHVAGEAGANKQRVQSPLVQESRAVGASAPARRQSDRESKEQTANAPSPRIQQWQHVSSAAQGKRAVVAAPRNLVSSPRVQLAPSMAEALALPFPHFPHGPLPSRRAAAAATVPACQSPAAASASNGHTGAGIIAAQ